MFAVAGADGADPVELRTDSAVTDGRWHDVVAVQSEDELRLYVDGSRWPARAASPADAGTGRWWLGGGLTGALDEFSVLDRPLAQAEVERRHPTGPR